MSLPRTVPETADQSSLNEQMGAVIHSLQAYQNNVREQAKGEAILPESELDAAVSLFDDIADELSRSSSGLNQRIRDLSAQLRSLGQRRRQEFREKATLNDRLTTLLKALPAGVVVLDARGLVQECNPAAISLLGEPLSGERWVDIIERCFSPREDDGHEVSLKDGRRLNIQTCSLEHGYGQLILLTDLTETRVLQEQLARNERLSAMGRMVASLAHQIRTPLSAAMLYAGHLASGDITPALRVRCAEKLQSRLSHLEQQVRDMLIFAKGDAPLAERIRLNELFEQTRAAAEGLPGPSGLDITWHLEPVEAVLLCNKDAMVGAVMNLINNACEALTGVQKPAIEVSFRMPGRGFVSIEVRDNGSGFHPRESARIMDAFYTTKSNGTGLGLAVVQSVAQAHHGRFFITSQGEGLGARAILTLPVNTVTSSVPGKSAGADVASAADLQRNGIMRSEAGLQG